MAFSLTEHERSLLPSTEEVAFYQEHGYYVSRTLFSAHELEHAIEASERYYAGERESDLPDGTRYFFGWLPKDGDCLRKNDYASLQCEGIAKIVRKPVLGAIAALLAQTSTIRLWHDQLLYKPSKSAGVSNVGWHTDRGYWRSCSSDNMLTAWIPFHAVDESLGPVHVVDRSHRFSQSIEGLDFFNPELGKLDARLQKLGLPLKKVPLVLGAGQVSFHHCLTIHGSGANLGSHPRRSIAVHLQPDDNHYVGGQIDNAGNLIGHGKDRFVRTRNGVPDYSDPAMCPVLWPVG